MDAMTPQQQAEVLQAEYLAWAEKKWAQDRKRLKSILKAWGF